jgi:hypothetical protein
MNVYMGKLIEMLREYPIVFFICYIPLHFHLRLGVVQINELYFLCTIDRHFCKSTMMQFIQIHFFNCEASQLHFLNYTACLTCAFNYSLRSTSYIFLHILFITLDSR